MTQRTLVLLKPDTVRRGLVGEVLSRFEAKGLTIAAMEQRTIDAAKADEHYAEHVERDFYPPLRAFVTSGPLVALVLEGDEAIEVVRAINGATDGRKAAPGTIRGTCRSPTARTSCTARTRRSPPSARSRSGSRTSERRGRLAHEGLVRLTPPSQPDDGPRTTVPVLRPPSSHHDEPAVRIHGGGMSLRPRCGKRRLGPSGVAEGRIELAGRGVGPRGHEHRGQQGPENERPKPDSDRTPVGAHAEG